MNIIISTTPGISEIKIFLKCKIDRYLAKVAFRMILASLPIDTTFLSVQPGFPANLLGIGRRTFVTAEVPPVCVLIPERSSFVGSEFPEALPSPAFVFRKHPRSYQKRCVTTTAPDSGRNDTEQGQAQARQKNSRTEQRRRADRPNLHNLRLIRFLHVVRPTRGFLLSQTTPL
jgi:hypothetical protein